MVASRQHAVASRCEFDIRKVQTVLYKHVVLKWSARKVLYNSFSHFIVCDVAVCFDLLSDHM